MKTKTLSRAKGSQSTHSVFKGFYTFIIQPLKRFVNMGRPSPKSTTWEEIKKYAVINLIAIAAFCVVLFSCVLAYRLLLLP